MFGFSTKNRIYIGGIESGGTLYNAVENVTSINQITKSAVYLHEGCSSMPCLAKTLTESVENYIKNQFKDRKI